MPPNPGMVFRLVGWTYFLALAGFLAAFFAVFLAAAFFVAIVSVTSSWQIRLTVLKGAC